MKLNFYLFGVRENVSFDNNCFSTSYCRTLSPTSARRELLEHPPILAHDVLQKLLSEAYLPLSKELSVLQEMENEGMHMTWGRYFFYVL